MSRGVLLFGGTADGRELAARLAAEGIEVTVCVAGDYGREMLEQLPKNERLHVLPGRMDEREMCGLMRQGGYGLVVDATHPYAVQVSENIQKAAGAAGLRALRLARESCPAPGCEYVESTTAAAHRLAEMEGNILLTTGSKELDAYAGIPDFAQRVYARVLPCVESVQKCEALGLPHSHIIAMQGPFSEPLNRALIHQLSIKILVSKDGGPQGGFPQKVVAAAGCGIPMLVIGRPPGAAGDAAEEILHAARRCAAEADSKP